jgi:hypothetical protein
MKRTVRETARSVVTASELPVQWREDTAERNDGDQEKVRDPRKRRDLQNK